MKQTTALITTTTTTTTTQESLSGEFNHSNHHPIACSRCRQLHKKCDKKLEGCTKCLKAGIECVYNCPQKRGKASDVYGGTGTTSSKSKKQKTDNTTSSNSSTSNTSSSSHNASGNTTTNLDTTNYCKLFTNSKMTPDTLIDFYFTFLCGLHPMIEKEKLKYFVKKFLPKFEKKSKLVVKPNNWIESIEELKCIHAFYLSIMALSLQMTGDLENFDIYLKKAEDAVANLAVEHSTQFYWAVTCHCLFAAYVGEYNSYKSGYYLTQVSYFISSQREECKSKFFQGFEIMSVMFSTRFQSETFTLQVLMELLKKMFKHTTNRNIEEVLLPGTWEYLMTAKLSQQNYILFKQFTDFIFKHLFHYRAQILKTLTDCHSETYYKAQKLLLSFMTEAFSFLNMKQIPEISYAVMEEIALKITLLTENELFSFVFIAAVNVVVEAAEFHLNACKQIEIGLKTRKATITTSEGKLVTFDYFSILEKDLTALKILAVRYRRVSRLYANLISEMTQLIERNRMLNISPTLFGSSIVNIPEIPQQDEILKRQLEQQVNFDSNGNGMDGSCDSESFLSDSFLDYFLK